MENQEDLIYKLLNPPTMSHVVKEEDMYSIMYVLMGQAAKEIKRLQYIIECKEQM